MLGTVGHQLSVQEANTDDIPGHRSLNIYKQYLQYLHRGQRSRSWSVASSVVEGVGDTAEEEGESDEDSEDTKENFSFKELINTNTRYQRRLYYRSRIPSPGPPSRSRSPRSSRGTRAGRRARARAG